MNGDMETKSLKEMSEQIARVYKSYETTGTKPWDYEIAAKDLVYQVGSLTKLVMQRNQERFADGKSQAEIDKGIADELADILAETLFIARALGIDLEKAWEDMVQSDEDKISARQ